MQTFLNDGFITIRPFEPGDIPGFSKAARESADQVGRWMPWCHSGYSIQEAETWYGSCRDAWSSEASYPFLIIDPQTQGIIGSVDINQINRIHRIGNIGYWVASSFTNKGVATAAVRLVARFGFHEGGLSRLEIVIMTDNIASRRVAEKAGAKFECVARNRLELRGKSYDAAVFSLIPADLGSETTRAQLHQ